KVHGEVIVRVKASKAASPEVLWDQVKGTLNAGGLADFHLMDSGSLKGDHFITFATDAMWEQGDVSCKAETAPSTRCKCCTASEPTEAQKGATEAAVEALAAKRGRG